MKLLFAILLLPTLLTIQSATDDPAKTAGPVLPAELSLPLYNLVAWYKLDEKAGDVAHDSVEPAADGRRSNAVVQIGSVPKLNFRSGFTLAARVKAKEGGFGQVVGSNGAGGLVVSLNQIKFASWGADWIADAYIPEL